MLHDDGTIIIVSIKKFKSLYYTLYKGKYMLNVAYDKWNYLYINIFNITITDNH